MVGLGKTVKRIAKNIVFTMVSQNTYPKSDNRTTAIKMSWKKFLKISISGIMISLAASLPVEDRSIRLAIVDEAHNLEQGLGCL